MFDQSDYSVRTLWYAVLPACQHMYLNTFAHPVHADMICHQRVPLLYCRLSENKRHYCLLCALYCKVCSVVNEGIWQYCIQPSNSAISLSLVSLWSTCVCSCILEEAWLWRVICREGGVLCFQSLIAIAILSEITYPTFNINQTTKYKEKITHCALDRKTFVALIAKKEV